MDITQVVLTGILAVFAGAGGSLIAAIFNRPKTNADAQQGHAAATVSLSADARAWAERFATDAKEAREHASAADRRSDEIERKADEAEDRAERAERRAVQAERRADEAERRAQQVEAHYEALESMAIISYGYVRQLQETVRELGGTPPPLPPELEELWNSSGGGI